MTFLDHVPEYIEQLDKEIKRLGYDRYNIDRGHECNCEFCHHEGDGADPDADKKAAKIDAEVRERQCMVERLERYVQSFGALL